MGLLICAECGRNISEHATSCPGCGAPISVAKRDSLMPLSAPSQKAVDLRNNLYSVVFGIPAIFVAIFFKESLPALGGLGFILSLVFAGIAIWTLVSFFRLCKLTTEWYILWFLLFFVPVLGLGILAVIVFLGFKSLNLSK